MISKHNTFQSDNLHTSTTTIWLSGRKTGETCSCISNDSLCEGFFF